MNISTDKKYNPSIFKRLKWKFEHFWYTQISSRINPRNKWLTDEIPRTYMDKDGLIQIVLFKCLVDFVEVEKGLEHSAWEGEEAQQYKKLIENCYESITKTLPELQKIADDIVYPWNDDDQKLFWDMTQEIEKLENLTCETIVKIRGVLWT